MSDELGEEYQSRSADMIAFLSSGVAVYRGCQDRLFLYLTLAKMLAAEDYTLYSFQEGARIIPMIANLSKKWRLLSSIRNNEQKITEMCRLSNQNVDATIFEILVALKYVELGYQVEFVPEGAQRTPDLLIEKDGASRYVECKKMQRGNLYSYKEIDAWYEVVNGVGNILKKYCICGQFQFKFMAELEDINPKRVFRKIYKKLDVCKSIDGPFHVVKNQDFRIKFIPIDPALMRVDLDPLRHVSGATLIEYLTGGYSPFLQYRVQCKAAMEGAYVSNLETAAVISCDFASYRGAQIKAQHVKRKLFDAAGQLANGNSGDVHILVEECNGFHVYQRRLYKNFEAVQSFNDTGGGVERVYVHNVKYLVPLDGPFDVEETVTSFNREGAIPETMRDVWYAAETYEDGLGTMMEEWR
jgi:hypothetical protein